VATHSTQPTSARTPFHVVRPEEGVVGPLRILAASEHTRGLYFALEWETTPARPDAPLELHAHQEHDESEYVLTGEREIVVDGQRWRGGPGLFVMGPRRVGHAMRTVGPTASRWLHFFSPAGLEQFFVQRERMRADGTSPEELRLLGERYGITDDPPRRAIEAPFASLPDARPDAVVATGRQTRNAYALAERSALPDQPHEHVDQEEAFYIISGELIVDAEGVEVVAPARSFVLVPRGLRHRHVTSARTRLLAVYSPGQALAH
jgi:quercetin dioxygenase-like cupin family protein